MNIEALKSTLKDFSMADCAKLNGYATNCSLETASPLLTYDIIIVPPPGCVTNDDSEEVDGWAEDINALTQAEADELIEDIWEDTDVPYKLGTPHTPVRIVRTT